MPSLPASMKKIWSRIAEKKWQHHFPQYKSMGIFLDIQGQLTPQSVVQSGQNSNSSELAYMSLLPASMERNGCKTAEKKWKHRFSHHNPIGYHGNQWSDLAECWTHPSSHVYMLSLPASLKRIRSRTVEKNRRHRFSHYKPMGIFSDVQGQLTPQLVVQSGRNWTCPSSHACNRYLQVWKGTDEKQPWKSGDNVFFHHNPVFYHGNQWLDLAEF